MLKRGGPVTADEAQVFERAQQSTMANPQVKLEELSKDTGGFFVANTNDLKGPLRKVSEEINTYYEITYSPAIEKYDGHFRKISVSVSRPEAKLQTRSGYYALPAVQGQDLLPYEVPMLSALSTSPIAEGGDVSNGCEVVPVEIGGSEDGSGFRHPVGERDPHEGRSGENVPAAHVFVGLIKDNSGSIVQKITRDVNSKGQLENYDATRAGHFIYTQYVTLAPGRYTLETAVLDRENEKLGAKKQAVIVAPPSKELAMSSLTLVRKLAQTEKISDPEDPFEFKGGKVTPELNETVKGGKGAGIGLYLVVYTPPVQASLPQPDTKLSLEFVQDGKLVAKSDLPMPKPDENGRINYVASLPIEALKPGQYEVYAKVFQAGKGVQERMMVNIEE